MNALLVYLVFVFVFVFVFCFCFLFCFCFCLFYAPMESIRHKKTKNKTEPIRLQYDWALIIERSIIILCAIKSSLTLRVLCRLNSSSQASSSVVSSSWSKFCDCKMCQSFLWSSLCWLLIYHLFAQILFAVQVMEYDVLEILNERTVIKNKVRKTDYLVF